jgi:hypothetical protein|tara:strand:+ start:8314 stop:8421 length:108 start_codon:yes stop_codon:yes gene_type:complete
VEPLQSKCWDISDTTSADPLGVDFDEDAQLRNEEI